MFKHILIPTDGTDLSRKAVIYGAQLAKSVGARITAISVSEPYHVASMDAVLVAETPEEHESQTSRTAERALEQVRMAAEAAGVSVETLREVNDQPYRAIIDCANACGCDLVVMASHGRRGVAALLVGSETTKVLTHSTIPVLVYR
jgi:nucleotide-binding universal stress UspA family protein